MENKCFLLENTKNFSALRADSDCSPLTFWIRQAPGKWYYCSLIFYNCIGTRLLNHVLRSTRVKTICFYFHLRDLVILKLLGHSIKTLCCFKENMSVGITQYDNEICAKCVCQHSTTEICSIT